jgi:hypothetical protein
VLGSGQGLESSTVGGSLELEYGGIGMLVKFVANIKIAAGQDDHTAVLLS